MAPYRGGPLSHGIRRDSSPRGRDQRVKKASQSLPPAGGKGILIIFCRGMYLTENTYQAASVRFVRQRRTNRARGRLQSFCQKRAKPFFDSLSSPRGRAKGGLRPAKFTFRQHRPKSVHFFPEDLPMEFSGRTPIRGAPGPPAHPVYRNTGIPVKTHFYRF